MKCKVFNSIKNTLEDEVNEWLESGNFEIIRTEQTQNETGYVTLTIFYLDGKELRKKKIEKIEKNIE